MKLSHVPYYLFFFVLFLSINMIICNADNVFLPPEAKDNLSSEENRNVYLEKEKEQIKISLKELDHRNIVIIPTPKNLSFLGNDIGLNLKNLPDDLTIISETPSSIPVEYFQKYFASLGIGKPITVSTTFDENPKKKGIYILLLNKETSLNSKYRPENIPNTPQGYAIKTLNDGSSRTYCLSAYDKDGLLYAAVTLSKLIKKNNDSISFPDVKISDWPDVLYRCSGSLEWAFRRRFWESKAKDAEEAKQYIDWALSHKMNVLIGVQSNDPYSSIGDPKFRTSEMRKWLKEVNTYAKERGIYVMLPQTFAIGISQEDKNKPEFKGCIDHRGGLFCWSKDELIDKKIADLNDYTKETGYSGIFFHSIDTRNSMWDERCADCKKRFGEDRMQGDANVINHFYNGIRKQNPDFLIAFVPRPYVGNLHKPEKLIERGELRNKDDMPRLSSMIPEDVYLLRRECNREEYLSWKRMMKQPLMIYQEPWIASLLRKNVSPAFRYAKTYFTPVSNEIFYYCSGWPTDDIGNIGTVEYSWNLNSPGSRYYEVHGAYSEDKTCSKGISEIWDSFGEDNSKEKDLQEYIKRACKDLYGIKEAPAFYKTFISFIDWNLIFDNKTLIDALKKLNIKCSDKEIAGWMKRTYDDSSSAVSELEKLTQCETSSKYTKEAVTYYLSRLYLIRAGSHVLYLAFESELASKEKNFSNAQKLLEEAFSALKTETETLKKSWHFFEKSPCLRTVQNLNSALGQLNRIKSILDLTKVKMESRMQMNSPKKILRSSPIPEKRNSIIKLALFDPKEKKGAVYGASGLLKTLKINQDINVTVVSDLTLENLKKYDCLIFPDCKSFGSSQVSAADLRSYVIDHGGGIYFEHDSCGFMRFPLQASLFPEIAEIDAQIGAGIKNSKYKEEERKLIISAIHPVTDGNEKGLNFQQAYCDHFQLKKGDRGITLLEDCYKKPVLISGEVGKGKVIFSGAITYDSSDKELDSPLNGPEGEIINNAIRWLANKEGISINVSDIKKKDEILSDATCSRITFTPEIVTAIPLHNARLVARCFNAENLNPLSEEIELCKIGNIDKNWKAQEELNVIVSERAKIKLSLILYSAEGRKTKNIILKN